MVYIEDLVDDTKVDRSTLDMDSKLIDDRQACTDAIDDVNDDCLMQILSEDMDYIEAELAEARPATVNLLTSTDRRIELTRQRFTELIEKLREPRKNIIELTRRRYFHYWEGKWSDTLFVFDPT